MLQSTSNIADNVSLHKSINNDVFELTRLLLIHRQQSIDQIINKICVWTLIKGNDFLLIHTTVGEHT